MRHGFALVAVVFLIALALALRLPQLGNRPFHGDEAVHAVKFQELWEHGKYAYDPNEFHGPTIYYAALPFVAASGHRLFADMQESDFRTAIAVLGAATVGLLLLLKKPLGLHALLWSGLFLALSPAFVFYSRYFIQEVFLAAFTLGFLGFALRGSAVGAGIFAGLMFATKETAALSLFAAGIAWFFALREGKTLAWRPILLTITIALAVAYLFLSGFFTNPAGPLGYLQTYTPWLRRAGGTDLHKHPWHYYLALLTWHPGTKGMVWSEGLILALGMVGAALKFRTRFGRFLTLYTLLLTGIYAVIPYKTPWCLLNFLLPWTLLAGLGAAGIVDATRSKSLKTLAVLLLLLGAAQLGWQAYKTSFVFQNDTHNPYIYSPTLPDADRFRTQLEALAQGHPDKFKMVIQVVSKDGYYWPLPWYLRRFNVDKIGYYTQVPETLFAPIVLASPEFDETLTPRLKGHVMTGFVGLRSGVMFQTFVEQGLWEAYLKKNGPVKDEREDTWVPSH